MLPIITLDKAEDFDHFIQEESGTSTIDLPSLQVVEKIQEAEKCIVKVRIPKEDAFGYPITNISEGFGILGDLDEIVELHILDWGNVEVIEDYALHYCPNLVKIPDTWSKVRVIGINTFSFSGISKLPEDFSGIEKIGELAFSHCENLTELPEAIFDTTISFGESVFACCPIREIKRWGVLKEIPHYFFLDCKIEKLPDNWESVEKVGVSAFENCRITKLPDDWGKVTMFEACSFANNDIATIPLRDTPLRFEETTALSVNPGAVDFYRAMKRIHGEAIRGKDHTLSSR